MPGSSLTAHSTDITRQPRQRITRQKLDKARQLLDSSTDLDAQAHGVSLDKPRQARQARPRQQLDGASTARQLDSQGSRNSLRRYCGTQRGLESPSCISVISRVLRLPRRWHTTSPVPSRAVSCYQLCTVTATTRGPWLLARPQHAAPVV